MTLLYNNIGVFDFETSSTDPETTQPLSLACIMIDPKKLEIVKDSEFYTLIKPENIATVEEKALEKNKLTIAELNEKGVSIEVAFRNFDTYLQKYRKGKGKSRIIPGGFNITNFDIPILRRLNKRFNISETFSDTKRIDLVEDFYRWLHNEEIISISMDSIREMLGMSDAGAHTAIGDVRDCAQITIRMLNLYRTIKPRFKGAFALK